MLPSIKAGDVVTVSHCEFIRIGDTVLVHDGRGHCKLHRVIRVSQGNCGDDRVLTQGDAQWTPDEWVSMEYILGRLESVRRDDEGVVIYRSGSLRGRLCDWLALARSRLRVILRDSLKLLT